MKAYIGCIIAIAILAISCRKKEEEMKVVRVPSIALIDEAVYSSPARTDGALYKDPGVRMVDEMGVESISTTPTESGVDLATPGFYAVKYKIKTQYGYDLSASRLVLITNVDPAVDLSGVYTRTQTGQEVNITKVGTGLYKTDNVGGVPDAPEYIYDIYFGYPNDSTVVLPSQYNPLGDNDLSGENESVINTSTGKGFEWRVIGSGYGTGLRTFIKN